jgi:ribonuclease BN (tRNA processing enzyme)
VQSLEVQHDDAVSLESDQAIVGEHAEKLVYALPRAADHRREVALRQGCPEADRAIAELLPGFVRQAGEPRGEAPGDIEEVQLLDVIRESTELRGERPQQGIDDRGLGCQQFTELAARQDQRLRRLKGRCRGGSRRAVEQGELPKDVAGTERCKNGLISGVRREHDLDRTSHDDEEGVTWVAEVEDDFAAAESPGAHPASDSLERGRIEPREEWDAGQRVGERASLDHEIHRTAVGPARTLELSDCRHRDSGHAVRRSPGGTLGLNGMTRVTIVGTGTSAPEPNSPASGILVETRSTGILIDCGQGVVRSLMPIRDPRSLDAVVIGHLHADHFIDLVSLRYLLPWAGYSGRKIPILLPPGGRQRMDELAAAISERERFFDDAFEVLEYDPQASVAIGDLSIRFIPGRHYVPAWGCSISDAAGRRIVVSGDTGPNESLVKAAHGAELFVVEATLLTTEDDDPIRGHLTADEALDMGEEAGVGQTVLVHYRGQDRDAIEAACRGRVASVVGRPGMAFELDPDAADWKTVQPVGETLSGIASSTVRAR